MCTYSRDCHSGCCQLDRSTKLRSCQPKALLGEKCSNAQVKADTYVDACPCVAGYGKCGAIAQASLTVTLSRRLLFLPEGGVQQVSHRVHGWCPSPLYWPLFD